VNPCEWNPKRNAAANAGDPDACPNEVEWSVGSNGEWHLCASCAALPRFKRYKTRKRIGATKPKPERVRIVRVTESDSEDWHVNVQLDDKVIGTFDDEHIPKADAIRYAKAAALAIAKLIGGDSL
jgi:hypothetical protein